MLGFDLCLWQHNIDSRLPPYVSCQAVQRLGSTSQGRIAFPLATGIGKTQSIASWCGQVHSMGLGYSLLVCQERVADLEELYRDLRSKGIPPDEIGLLHSKVVNPERAKKGEDYATLPSCRTDEVEGRRFLLVTHAKIKAAKDIDQLNTFMDGERSLVIWDESLLRNEGRSVQASVLEHAWSIGVGKIRGRFADADAKEDDEAKDALDYVERALDIVHTALRTRAPVCDEPLVIPELPSIDGSTIEDYQAAIRRIVKGHSALQQLGAELCHFLAFCQEPLRLVNLGSGRYGEGVITYLPSVPPFPRIVVLDASYLIRELCQLDDSLKLVADYEHVKRFDQVKVRQVKANGGRTTVQRLRINSVVTKRVVQDVLSIPEDEGILIVTYKSKGRRRGTIEALKDALEAAGVNLDASVMAEGWSNGRRIWFEQPRIQFIHWGQHKAVSKFRYCRNMIAVGVMRRDRLDLASNIAAQVEDHDTPLATDRAYLDHVIASEQFYALQQFIGRGSCREITNGDAKPANVIVYDQGDFSPFIDHGLPGVQWVNEEAPEGARKRARKAHKAERIAAKIVSFVNRYEGERITVRYLKTALGLRDVPPQTFKRARDLALRELSQWRLEGHGLVKAVP